MARLTVPSPTGPNRVLADPLHDPEDTVSFAQEVELPSVHCQDSVEVPMPDESERDTASVELGAIVEEGTGATESTAGQRAARPPSRWTGSPSWTRRRSPGGRLSCTRWRTGSPRRAGRGSRRRPR